MIDGAELDQDRLKEGLFSTVFVLGTRESCGRICKWKSKLPYGGHSTYDLVDRSATCMYARWPFWHFLIF